MASQFWHKMNSIMYEIERNRERINRVTIHIIDHKGGFVASGMVETLKSNHDDLYDQMHDHCTAWLKKLEENK